MSVLFDSSLSEPLSIDVKEAWKGSLVSFAKSTHAGAGFSFQYEGRTIGPELPNDWTKTAEHDNLSNTTKITLAHKSGLTVVREMRSMPDFGATEYSLIFKNSGAKPLSPVSNVQPLNISFTKPVTDKYCMTSSSGGFADGLFPPGSFSIRRNCFGTYSAIELKSDDGRSSNKDLPLFLLHNETRREGAFFAIGWTGQWAAIAARNQETLSVKGRIPGIEIALEPGEEIKGPTVMLGFYKGTVEVGSNQLRRTIRTNYTPKLSGREFLPTTIYDTWFAVHLAFNDQLLRNLVDGAAALGQEYFLIDAGWYSGTKGDLDFMSGLGNWHSVDRKKLPDGLKPVAAYVRSKGLKLGLWFEPEQVAPDSQLARDHPSWILWNPHPLEPWDPPLDSHQQKYNGVLNYGLPEVQEWVRNMLDQYIREYEIRYIRYDFNIDPLPYWQRHDQSNRRGVTQLRHIQGLYAIIDWVREHHPDTVLEGSAAGGRRIDLETARRFHTFWINDSTLDPAVIRFHLFGINNFLPGNYHSVQYTQPWPMTGPSQPDDLSLQSLFGGAFGIGGRVDLWSAETKKRALLHVDTYKKLRRYLVEDYYPLSRQPADLNSWSGWQFQDPVDKSGFIQTFRTNTPNQTQNMLLHELDGLSSYRFTDAYTGASFEIRGDEAMATGISITQDPMSSKILMYRKLTISSKIQIGRAHV